MIKKITLLIGLFVAMHQIVLAQGINFSTGTWKEIIQKAKKEKKIIFVDVYADWCAPCKTMDKEVFTNDAAGKYFNATFVNYKIDAEKGEGVAIAQKYSVQAYPTLIFVNPNDESLVTKYIGGCDANDLIKRGQQALEEHLDPMKWSDYLKKIEQKKYDKAFIIKALEKASNSNRNNDALLDIYVNQFASQTFNEEEIQFLVNNTKTLDNAAVNYIAKHLSFQQRDAFMEEFTAELNMGTYEKAVEQKRPEILDRIKDNQYQINKSQSIPTHFYYLQKYYNALGDTANYWSTVEREVNYYMNKANKDYQIDDSLAFEEIQQNYKKQLSLYGVPESEHKKTIAEALQKNPEARISVSYMSAMQINEHITNLLMQHSKDKYWMQKAEKWGEKMLALVDNYPEYKSYFSISNAYVLAANGKKEQAINNLKAALTGAKNNKELTQSINDTILQLQ